jgi:hypothetical protein
LPPTKTEIAQIIWDEIQSTKPKKVFFNQIPVNEKILFINNQRLGGLQLDQQQSNKILLDFAKQLSSSQNLRVNLSGHPSSKEFLPPTLRPDQSSMEMV